MKKNLIIEWGIVREMTTEEKATKERWERTEKATRGKNRIYDPFLGWIEKKEK